MLLHYKNTCVGTCMSQFRCACIVRGNPLVLVLAFQSVLRQGLCALAAYTRPDNSLVPISHPVVQAPAFQMCITAPRFKWVLGTSTHVLLLVWHSRHPLSRLLSSGYKV